MADEATKVKRKRGWPLAQRWHSGLWRDWDRLTPRQRLDYEATYQAKRDKIILVRCKDFRPIVFAMR